MAVPTDLYKYFKNLDWDKLKSFYFVAKESNISTAAKLLNMTISPLSRQISTLEKQLGYPLFSRSTVGVTLTRRGEALFAIAERMFLDIKEFSCNSYKLVHEGQKRKLRILSTYAICAYLLKDAVLDFQESNPHITIELIGNDQLIDIYANDIDLAIRPFAVESNNVKQEPLFILEKKLYASRDYIKRYGEPKQVDDLINHRLICMGSAPKNHLYSDLQWIVKLGMPLGKKHTAHFMSNSLECAVEAAKRGIGIIGSYGEMSIIAQSGLVNILPSVKDKAMSGCLVTPDFLKDDVDISNIKDFFLSKISFGITGNTKF